MVHLARYGLLWVIAPVQHLEIKLFYITFHLRTFSWRCQELKPGNFHTQTKHKLYCTAITVELPLTAICCASCNGWLQWQPFGVRTFNAWSLEATFRAQIHTHTPAPPCHFPQERGLVLLARRAFHQLVPSSIGVSLPTREGRLGWRDIEQWWSLLEDSAFWLVRSHPPQLYLTLLKQLSVYASHHKEFCGSPIWIEIPIKLKACRFPVASLMALSWLTLHWPHQLQKICILFFMFDQF